VYSSNPSLGVVGFQQDETAVSQDDSQRNTPQDGSTCLCIFTSINHPLAWSGFNKDETTISQDDITKKHTSKVPPPP
jgi:hypothetical protein